jgi:glycosyltransferase involved in cell wall biosynthesis
MKILHIIKTVDGARWAVDQVQQLVSRGYDVHVVLPVFSGRFIDAWKKTGAVLHVQSMDLPVAKPWELPSLLGKVYHLVNRIAPDIIHSHFFGTTIMLRMALGKDHPVPRLFQVPGPLHMEHTLFRQWDLTTASSSDRWIASSLYVQSLYQKKGVPLDRLFLSYYGNATKKPVSRPGFLRKKLGIAPDSIVIGNINHIYKPKWYLGQTKGLKGHEVIIEALANVCEFRKNVTGVLAGSQWGTGHAYEERLRKKAAMAGPILMPGHLAPDEVLAAWSEFDLAVHMPTSENCGGVIEPLLAGIPVIAARVGGLPEVVLEGLTGTLVEKGDVAGLTEAIIESIDKIEEQRAWAQRGSQLVSTMFDSSRTAAEIASIYEVIKGKATRLPDFNSREYTINKLQKQ